MCLLKIKNLHYSYHGLKIVEGLSFTLDKGQILGFLGSNGAGKSTTMKMIAGVIPAQEGEIFINNMTIDNHPKESKSCIGYLPEHPPLYLDLTVTEYLKFCAQIKLLPNKEVNNAVETVLNQCNLLDVKDRLIGHLSKGFQQRVGIAQAIIHKPELIILDEPTVGLDPIQIGEIRALIKSLANDHAVIISTHILSEVIEVCTLVQIISSGKLVYQANMSDLQTPDSLETIFMEKAHAHTA